MPMNGGKLSAWLGTAAGLLLRVLDDPVEMIRECFNFGFPGVRVQQGQRVAEEIRGGFFRDEQVVLQLLFCGAVLNRAVFCRDIIGELPGCLIIDLLGEFHQFVVM